MSKQVAFPFVLVTTIALGACVAEQRDWTAMGDDTGSDADHQAGSDAGQDADSEAPESPQGTPAVYNGVCGPGYEVIDSHQLSGGTTYLTFNNGTGKKCAVTIRNTPGSPIMMLAEVSLAGQPGMADNKPYTTYAGPVYVYAPKACIDWGGAIGQSAWQQFASDCD